MKKLHYTIICAFTILFLFAGCANMNIDRGKIEDNFTISIAGEYPGYKNAPILPFNKPIVIKSGTLFSLSNLKLTANLPTVIGKVCTPNGYKQAVIAYEVKIQAEDGKILYGRIAFFQAKNYASAKAVTSYYKITFSQKFDEASNGRVAFYYEYYDKYPTWIMWASDVPLK